VVGAMLAAMLMAATSAFALNPALDVSQYAHTAWKIRDGFARGSILSIAQTPDGYLWVGTAFGLYRFDGVRIVPWQPPPDQHLSANISRLVAARDGTLWIGTRNGLASWKNGKLTQYAELAGSVIYALVEDDEGSIWAGTIGPPAAQHLIHMLTSYIPRLNASKRLYSFRAASKANHKSKACAIRNSLKTGGQHDTEPISEPVK